MPGRYAPLAGISCWSGDEWVYGYNAFNVEMWEFYVVISWCDNGSTITTTYFPPTVRATVTSAGVFWSYKGIVGSSQSGGVGNFNWTVNEQGEFQSCLPKVGCIQSSYPWVQITAHANGTFSRTWGG